jgi:hypothetical protein
MSASNPSITPGNIVLTPQQVFINGVDVGSTEGGVTISPKYKMADIHADQSGSTVLDKFVSGQEYTAKFTLAETANKANWKIAFPSAFLVGSGQSMYFDLQVGDRLSTHTTAIVFHPISKVPTDHSQDITFFQAACINASEVKYGPDKQTGLNVELHVLPDTTTTPMRFMLFGDPSVGLVAATAAAPGFTGTGNGTVTGVSGVNSKTKTEVITIKCVGQTSGNDFAVSGSLSGALGDFHVDAANLSTVPVVTTPISFTITQGATQFVYGDTFTINTTASNYA